MKRKNYVGKLLTGASMCLAMGASAVMADEYPSKIIEVVTHAGNGGGTDVTTRMMMLRARRELKQDMVVVNKNCLLYTSPSPRD